VIFTELETSLTPLESTRDQSEKASTNWDIYKEARVYKPVVILVVLFLFQQLSGAYVIIFYAVDIFVKIGGNFGGAIDAYGALVLLG
jgi:facilitated trehalose transporter